MPNLRTTPVSGLWVLSLVAYLCANAQAAEPAVTLTVLPEESGSLFYAPMGRTRADEEPKGKLWFELDIRNDGATNLTLQSLRVTLQGVDVSIPKPVVCAAGTTEKVKLEGSSDPDLDELVEVPHPAPGSVTIRAYFKGNPTPKSIQRPLIPYVPDVAGGRYLFPADEGDIGPDQYFAGGVHEPPHPQGWGTDWKVYRVTPNGSKTDIVDKTDGTANEHKLGWGVPIRAIADGIVLRVNSGYANNPKPGRRALQRMSILHEDRRVRDVRIVGLGTTSYLVERVAGLLRLDSGLAQLAVWQTKRSGRSIELLGATEPDPRDTVTRIAADNLDPSRVVAAFRLANGRLRVLVWTLTVTDEGLAIDRSTGVDGDPVTEVSVAALSTTRFVTAARTVGGELSVRLWEAPDAGGAPRIAAEATVSGGTSVVATPLGETRFATSFRNPASNLMVSLWDLVASSREPNSTISLQKRGEETADAVTHVDAARVVAGKWVTAVRRTDGTLKLIQWSPSKDGSSLVPELETTPGVALSNARLSVTHATGGDGPDNVLTASIGEGANFEIHGWGNPDKLPGKFEDSADNSDEEATEVSVDETGEAMLFFAGARKPDGTLALSTWKWGFGGGNSVYVLHGDVRVFYAHFQENSIDLRAIYAGAPVAAGQILGRMGNSGSAGDVHTHIHAERLEALAPIDRIIADEAAGQLKLIGFRPFPFSAARATGFADLRPGGEDNPTNSFHALNGEGSYSPMLAIRPRTRTRYLDPSATGTSPTGGKEIVPDRLPIGGPYRGTVGAAAGASPAASRLYIRGGTYDERVVLTRPMTLLRYDYYRTDGPVIIGR